MKLKINPELQAYLDRADAWADTCLESEIVADGEPRDAIIVWEETGEIVDGHRRYAICERHGLRFSVVKKSFPHIEAVKQWMEVNQLERRNLDRSTSREIYERVIALASTLPADATDGEARTARRTAIQKVAEATGTTERNVYHNVACEEVLSRFSGSYREWLSTQTVKSVAALKKLSDDEIIAIVDSVLAADYDTLADAIKAKFGKSPKQEPTEAAFESLSPPQESEQDEVPDDEPVYETQDDDEPDDEPSSESADSDDEEDDDFRPASSQPQPKPSPKPESQLIESAKKQLGYLMKAMDEFNFDRAFHNRLISKAREIGALLDSRKQT